MITPSHLTPFLLLPLSLASPSSPPPTPTTPCPNETTWTITSLSLTDFATPNLITLRADRRRKLDFEVSSPALPTPHKCTVDTGYEKVEEIQQFNTWTYRCWNSDKLLIGSPDAALAFKFESAVGDQESAHPAKFSLVQKRECGPGKAEVEGTVDITLSCAMPPDCGGPCFDRQCDGTAFIVYSKV